MDWTAPAMQRRDALAQYLTELGLDYAEPRGTVPETLTIGSVSLAVEPWERGIVQHSLCHPTDRSKPWAPLLAEGLALQFKCLAAPPPTGAAFGDPEELERLIVDTAVGLALMAETQRCIDQLVVAGEMAEAKKLAASRNRIVQCVALLKERIGEDACARAENKAGGMIAPAPAHYVTGSTGPDPATAAGRAPKAAFGKRPRVGTMLQSAAAVAAKPRRMLGVMTGVLAVAFVVWVVFYMPRLLRSEPPVLEQVDFATIEGVVSIHARPPSVYVNIDDAAWKALGESGRMKLVADIGAVAQKAGYNGAQMSLVQSRTPVGRWLKQGGASLIGS